MNENDNQKLIEAINDIRKIHGIGPVKQHVCLMQAAQKHVDDMIENDFLSHIGSDGSTYIDRIKNEECQTIPFGEIICKGPGGKDRIASVVRGWANSPGHRDIMLSEKPYYIGVASSLKDEKHSGNYWLAIFSYITKKAVMKEPLLIEDEE